MKSKIRKLGRGIILRLLRVILPWTLRWKPIESVHEGYSIIIGCNAPLASMLAGNLEMIRRQNRENLKQIHIVFDRTRGNIDETFETSVKKRFAELPLEFHYYTSFQALVAHAACSPWVYCWMSWCIAIAAVQTRYVFLHDFDAMLIRPDFCEDRYHTIRKLGVEYLGIQIYRWGDVAADSKYVQTFEMIFNSAFVRERFKPITLFNQFRRVNGKTIELDSFLDAQFLAGKRDMVPALVDDLVHPGQVISQFLRLMHYRGYVPPEKNNLFWVPYFIMVGGDSTCLDDLSKQMATTQRYVTFFGKRMDLRELSAEHVKKMTTEMLTLEQAVAGTIRPDIAEFLDRIARFVERRDAAADNAKSASQR